MLRLFFVLAVFAFSYSNGYSLPPQDGAEHILNRESFDRLSALDDVPGSIGVRTIKFLVTDVQTDTPNLYFINTNTYNYHYDFATNGLGLDISLNAFNQLTYFTDNRSFLAGTILVYDHFVEESEAVSTYVFEFWLTDPVKARFTHLVYQLLSDHMAFAKDHLFYHPAGNTQELLCLRESEEYKQNKTPVIFSKKLFQNITFSPLHLGEGYGYLRVANFSEPATYTVRDVVIFKSIPNELSHVAGVLTEEPQTPLSHINLKAKQNNTPNAYLKEASSKPEINHLIGKPVYFKVSPQGVELRAATAQEIEEHLEKIRPTTPFSPLRDFSVTQITPLDQIGSSSAAIFGAKAANVGEMKSFLSGEVEVPDGFGVPFFFYDTFMRETGLYNEVESLLKDPEFAASPEKREAALKLLRKKIKSASMPASLQQRLTQMHQAFQAGTPIRCRSSTNNEDLPGFNGAGLYDSYTHRPGEGEISETIKKVFASLWNFRAFEEREFYRINHFTTAMGVLVHPNFDNEVSNGVAVTKNPYYSDWDGCYINVQVGEELVTNPDPGATPDEILIMKTLISHDEEGAETVYIRHSSLIKEGDSVMTDEQIHRLVGSLKEIQEHFSSIYNPSKASGFAMDVEFKIDSNGRLVIKQARPWVD